MALHQGRSLVSVDHAKQVFLSEAALHGLLVVVGIAGVVLSNHKKLRVMIATSGSFILGLWVGVVMHDWEALPERWWIPVLAGTVAGIVACSLSLYLWSTLQLLLFTSVFTVVGMALSAVAGLISLEDPGKAFTSPRLVAIFLALASLVLSWKLRKKYGGELLAFSSVHMGMALLLTGVSYFFEKLLDQPPMPLSDSLSSLITRALDDRCVPNSGSVEGGGCGCSSTCKVEILRWILHSWLILLGLALFTRSHNQSAEPGKHFRGDVKIMDESAIPPNPSTEMVLGKAMA